MDRVRRLTIFFLLAFFSGFLSFPVSAAGVSKTQAQAFAACSALAANDTAHGSPASCPGPNAVTPQIDSSGVCVDAGANPTMVVGSYSFLEAGQIYDHYPYCGPASCDAHDSGSPDQQWGGVYENGILYCNDGCMSVFHMAGGVGSLQFSNGDGGSWGHFVGNGNRCASSIDASLLKAKSPAPSLCDHGSTSCYNAQRGFCATSESGEMYCEPAPPPGSGGCAVGATGASCVGNNTPPPTPPDPPIQKGDPPTSAATATGTDSGGTTNNYTTNNYSGTSPGSGGGGSPVSGSSSAGGSQSNSNGNGNSPGPNSSSGTGATGKCADGSVPTASGCSGTATDNGCNTPPQCFGDAVLCGSYKEQVATRCAAQKIAAASASSAGANYGTPSSALAAAGVPADGGASGDPAPSSLVSSSDLGTDGFDASGLGFSRTCPASPQFSVFGRTYTLDLTPMCNFASMFGWVVLLLSYLAALRIVSTGKA